MRRDIEIYENSGWCFCCRSSFLPLSSRVQHHNVAWHVLVCYEHFMRVVVISSYDIHSCHTRDTSMKHQ